MSNLVKFQQQEITVPQLSSEAVEKVLIQGNLKTLSPQDRVSYYGKLCQSLGLNPLTQPFEYLEFQGKLQLYAKKSCTEQLRHMYNISVRIVSRDCTEGCYIVTAQASMPSGRQDESLGAVNIDGLKGEARSNAMMKAETKAKRRVTLSICGLAYLDESEVESVRGATHVPVSHETGEIAAPAPAETLAEDIQQHPPKETKASAKSSTPFNVLEYFAAIKKRFTKLKREDAYYEVLSHWGAKKSNQFPATEAGMLAARGCYKELQLRIADLEIPVATVDALPDPVPLAKGTRLQCGGKLHEVVDSQDGYIWSEVK